MSESSITFGLNAVAVGLAQNKLASMDNQVHPPLVHGKRIVFLNSRLISTVKHIEVLAS